MSKPRGRMCLLARITGSCFSQSFGTVQSGLPLLPMAVEAPHLGPSHDSSMCADCTFTRAQNCSEQSLRILMWNASYVQKHSNCTWQEGVGEKTREKSKGTIAMSSARWNKLTDRANREVGKPVVWKRHDGSWVSHAPSQQVDVKWNEIEAGTSFWRPRMISRFNRHLRWPESCWEASGPLHLNE